MAKKQSKEVAAEKVVAEVVSVPAVVSLPDRAGQLTDREPDCSLVLAQLVVDRIASEVREACEQSAESFVTIGSVLKKARDDAKQASALSAVGYSDVYDFALKAFGFKKTSVKNFIAVFDRFGDKDRSCPSLAGKYSGYSFTQLVELLPVAEDISSYKPDMSVSEIRDKKVLERIKEAKDGLYEYVFGRWSEALKPYFSSFLLSSGSGREDVPYGWDGYVILFFSGSPSCCSGGKALSGFLGFDPSRDRFVSSGLRFGRSGAPWQLSSCLEGDSLEDLRANVRKAFKALSNLVKEKKVSKSDAKKAKEAAKKEKPEWQLWHEMSDSDKALSLSPAGFRDPKFHVFFVSRYLYPDGGVVDATSYPSRVVRSFCTFEFGQDKKPTGKVLDVLYVWRGDGGRILFGSSSSPSGVLAVVGMLDAWCEAELDRGEGVKESAVGGLL